MIQVSYCVYCTSFYSSLTFLPLELNFNLNSIHPVAADPSVKIEVDNPLVEPGADFALRCVAADLVGGTSFLRIRKTITKPDGSLNILDLATNTLLSKSSEQIGRYSVTFEAGTDSKVLTFIFSIKGMLKVLLCLFLCVALYLVCVCVCVCVFVCVCVSGTQRREKDLC